MTDPVFSMAEWHGKDLYPIVALSSSLKYFPCTSIFNQTNPPTLPRNREQYIFLTTLYFRRISVRLSLQRKEASIQDTRNAEVSNFQVRRKCSPESFLLVSSLPEEICLCWQKVAMVYHGAVSRIPNIYYYERRLFCKIVKLDYGCGRAALLSVALGSKRLPNRATHMH